MAKFSAKGYGAFLQKKVDEATKGLANNPEFKNKAASIVRDTVYQTVKENVYDSYSPTIYERRGENNGLLDRENIEVNFVENKIIAGDMAEPNDSLFGTPIQSSSKRGLLYKWMDEDLIGYNSGLPFYKHYAWTKPRVGMTEKIINELRNNAELCDLTAKAIKKEIK